MNFNVEQFYGDNFYGWKNVEAKSDGFDAEHCFLFKVLVLKGVGPSVSYGLNKLTNYIVKNYIKRFLLCVKKKVKLKMMCT